MVDPEATAGRNAATIFLVGISVVLFAAILVGRELMLRSFESNRRASMRKQIANVRADKSDSIWLSTDDAGLEMDELINAKHSFQESDDFELSIEYSDGVDEFLDKLSGIRGVTRLSFHKSIVTDAGMGRVASFPDLRMLTLEQSGVTDAGIAALCECPRLEEVVYIPYELSPDSISALLSLPHLRKLTVYGPYESTKLRDNLSQFAPATNLKELILIDDDLPSDAIDRLRDQLPGCKVTAIPSGKST